MTPTTPLAIGLRRAAWVGVSIVAILIPLVPLGHQAEAWLVPDLLFCVTIIWVIREPRITTMGLIAIIGLIGDIFLGRPLGLGAIMLLLVSEAFRQQARFFQENPYILEWLATSLFYLIAQLAMSLMLLITFADPPPMGVLLRYVTVTALAYPVITALLILGMRLRSPPPGQVSDRLGRVR